MAWVLKMDEVIESGLVHDFDASLTGIGQELGAGAYSMRYGTPWAGRAGGRADGRTPPYPWEGPAGPWAFARRGCDQRCPGPTRLGVRACRVAAGARQPRRPLPTPVAGLGGGRPCHLRPRNRWGFHFCCKTRPAVNEGLGWWGRGFISLQAIYEPHGAGMWHEMIGLSIGKVLCKVSVSAPTRSVLLRCSRSELQSVVT